MRLDRHEGCQHLPTRLVTDHPVLCSRNPDLRIGRPPRDGFARIDVATEPPSVLGVGQVPTIDQRASPDGVQVGFVAELANLHVVTTAVFGIASVKRLMDVAHDMHDEFEGKRLLFARRIRIAHGLRKPRERAQSVAFFGCANVGVGLTFGHVT